MARKNQNKPIVELDKPGGKVKLYWPSSKSAADFYKINQVNISYNINGITKQAKGHYFRSATPQEIAAYEQSLTRIDSSKNAAPQTIESVVETPNTPAETIPEVVKKEENPTEHLSPFDLMLQKSKEKLKENSN